MQDGIVERSTMTVPLDDLVGQARVVKSAPGPFTAAVVAAAAGIWGVFQWSYTSVLNNKNAQIELLDRQLADVRQVIRGHGPPQKGLSEVNGGAYRAQLSDDVLEVIDVPATIVLPSDLPKGKSIVIKDKTGQVYKFPIRIVAEGCKIEGGLSEYQIVTNRGSWAFIWDGKEWVGY
jgi:hypothetical protein